MNVTPMLNAIPTVTMTVMPNISLPTTVTALFQATFQTAASYGSVAIAAITAHIIPITIGLVSVTVALVYLWNRVYGASVASALASAESSATSPAAANNAPHVEHEAAPVVAQAPVLPDAAAPVIPHAPTTPAPKPPKVSSKERYENEFKHLPQITHLGTNQYRTKVSSEKLERKDGQFFCHFPVDRDGFKANERYLVVGWMPGKEKNTYLVLEKPVAVADQSGTPSPAAPSTPSPVDDAAAVVIVPKIDTEAVAAQNPKLRRKRTSSKINVGT